MPRVLTKLFTTCSVLMATLFAYSASVQLNDPDWYFWFPLYIGASAVNLASASTRFSSSSSIRRKVARLTFWGGQLLMWKVVVGDHLNGAAGFWCLDLSQRVVREKVGSWIVVASMALHLVMASCDANEGKMKKRYVIPKAVDYGMLGLVMFSFGLPFVFFVVKGGEMKF
ncbi:hypothetical protein LINGRAHAP2_LOCUS8945 [Linum grandiflorum]